MVIQNKIEAIKAIREAATHAQVVKDPEGRMVIQCGVGLKEAKDLYEAIEVCVIRRFVNDLAHTSQVARGLLIQLESTSVE